MKIFRHAAVTFVILSIIFLMCKDDSPTDEDTEGTAEWQTVFFDDFNRSDGPAGNSYSLEIYEGSGTFSITDSMLVYSGGGFYAVRYVNEVSCDVIRVSMKCRTMAAANLEDYGIGVCIKSSSLYNGYLGIISRSETSIGIYKMYEGVLSYLKTEDYNVRADRSYSLELTINDNNFTLIVTDLTTGISDTLNVTDTDSLLTGNLMGISGIQSEGEIVYFDDLKIEKYE